MRRADHRAEGRAGRGRTLAGTVAALLLLLCGAAVRAAPDTAHGAQVYQRCLACHALAYDRVGPRHCGLFGRRAGSVPGFAYSPAMQKSKIVWDDKSLDLFLANPMKDVPGTAMTYDGVTNPTDRSDLIAYLKQANRSAECGH
ncbi:MAG: c-type cytochrome [Pseudomonadota bacterium]